MPVLYAVGGDAAPLYAAAFVVYWCYGTQLSVRGSCMPATPQVNIDLVLTEDRIFECSEEFRSKAHVKSMAEYERLYREAETDPDKFWGDVASELHWFKKWDKVREWDCPWAKWFSGGELNLSYNCPSSLVRGDPVTLCESDPGQE